MSEKMEQTEHYLLGKMCSGDQDCKHECPCTAEELAALRATVAKAEYLQGFRRGELHSWALAMELRSR